MRSLPVHLAVHEPEHEDVAESAPIGERDGRDEEEEEGRKGQKGEEEEAANADVGLDASASEVYNIYNVTHTHTHTHTHSLTHTHTHTHTCVCVYIYVILYICSSRLCGCRGGR